MLFLKILIIIKKIFGCVVCEILVPWPGIELNPSSLEARILNHWTTREVLRIFIY